jgi:NAD(P)H-flavin reductase
MPPETELAAGVGPMTPRMYRVIDRREDLRDTVTVRLAPVDDVVPLPAAGQFNMLWAFGIGEAPVSVSGIEDGVLTHTIRSVGAVTTALCAADTGDQLGVRGPFGTGWELARAAGRDILVVAGGLGLAPLRPLISELLDQRADYGHVTVLVGARTPETLLYWDELQQWRTRLDIDVNVTVDVATPSWRDDVGVVTRLIDQAHIDPVDTTAFVCGPEVMMRFAAQAIVQCGVPSSSVIVSLERNMHCAIGHCGHCQLGPDFICKDGPVMAWSRVEHLLRVRER